MWYLGARGLRERGLTDCQAVLRAAGETETSQGNIQDRVQLSEGDPVLQLLTQEETAEVMFLFILPLALPMLFQSSFIFLFFIFLSFRTIACFINPGDISPHNRCASSMFYYTPYIR
jgi:hypothetical protein